jgi:uncharacterized integral membrane protein
LGFLEVEAPEFLDSRHMKVVRLQPYAPAVFTPRKDSWYSVIIIIIIIIIIIFLVCSQY